MSSWTPTKYKTRNWAEYNFSLKKRGSLSIWFDPQMTWEADASGRRGRPQIYSDAAIQACLNLKVLFALPLGWIGRCQTSAHCVDGKERCPFLFHTEDQRGRCIF